MRARRSTSRESLAGSRPRSPQASTQPHRNGRRSPHGGGKEVPAPAHRRGDPHERARPPARGLPHDLVSRAALGASAGVSRSSKRASRPASSKSDCGSTRSRTSSTTRVTVAARCSLENDGKSRAAIGICSMSPSSATYSENGLVMSAPPSSGITVPQPVFHSMQHGQHNFRASPWSSRRRSAADKQAGQITEPARIPLTSIPRIRQESTPVFGWRVGASTAPDNPYSVAGQTDRARPRGRLRTAETGGAPPSATKMSECAVWPQSHTSCSGYLSPPSTTTTPT